MGFLYSFKREATFFKQLYILHRSTAHIHFIGAVQGISLGFESAQ